MKVHHLNQNRAFSSILADYDKKDIGKNLMEHI